MNIEIIKFRFLRGDDMFYIPWNNNGEELKRLYSLIEKYREQISSGKITIYIDGYCSSLSANKTDNQ